MREKIEQILLFILENGPTILTVGFAAYIVLLSQTRTLDPTEVSIWILALLGLIATSELVERFTRLRRIEKISRQTLDIVEQGQEPLSAESFFTPEGESQPLGPFFESAKDIWISGMNLRRTVTSYLGTFESRLKDGCSIKFLLTDPKSEAVNITARRNVIYTDPHRLKQAIESSLENLRELSDTTDKERFVETRVLDYVPAFGLMMFDPMQPSGRIRVELYPYRSAMEQYPFFWVYASQSDRWYEFFCNQFRKMWDVAKPV